MIAVDRLKVFLVVESTQVSKHWPVNSGNGSPGSHFSGHAGSNNVDFVRASHCKAQIGRNHTRLEQHTGLRSRPCDGSNVILFVDRLHFFSVSINHRDTVIRTAKLGCNGGTNRSRSKDYYVHS